VEAFDGAENKKMLVEVLSGTGKFVVSASGISGIGDSDTLKTRKIGENLVIIGDQISDVSLVPSFSPRVNMAAAKQADAVLEYILGGDGLTAFKTGGGDK
jgi:sulfur carrier protein ThiS adenylyltransferase